MELKLEQLRTLEMEAPAAAGRAAHVSAASGLVKLNGKLWIAADDETCLAVFDGPGKGRWVPVLAGELPLEKEARRELKPDFEALALLPGGELFLVASGSAPNRTKGVVLGASPKVVELGALVQARNVEGAAVVGGSLKLLCRSANAVIDVELDGFMEAIARGESPGAGLIRSVTSIELGDYGGVRLGFTDASPLPDGRLVFTAAAEDTDDPKYDGAVTGSVVGVLSADNRVESMFRVPQLKLEGVHGELQGAALHVLLVSDADDEAVAAPLMSAVL